MLAIGLAFLIPGLLAFWFGTKSDYGFRRWFQLFGGLAAVLGAIILVLVVADWLT